MLNNDILWTTKIVRKIYINRIIYIYIYIYIEEEEEEEEEEEMGMKMQ